MVVHRSGVCCSAILSVVRKMSEARVHISVEQRIIIKFLTKEGCKPPEICSRLKSQHDEKTLSNVSVYKWSSAFKKGREPVENGPYERRPRTSVTGENSDRVDALIWDNRRITVRELFGILNISDGSVTTILNISDGSVTTILNISDGSVTTISKDSHQEQEEKGANIRVVSLG